MPLNRTRGLGRVSLLLVVALVGVVGSSMANGSPDAITEKDNRRRIGMTPGGILTPKLEAIPGTGYSWHVIEDEPDLLDALGSSIFEPISGESRNGIIGGSVYQLFRFRAKNSGTVLLQLHCKRGWESKGAPLKTFSITVPCTI